MLLLHSGPSSLRSIRFCHVCLGFHPGRVLHWTTLLGGWCWIGLVVITGPTVAQNTHLNGLFYGISGYWCWISPAYTTSHILLDYIFMFIAAGSSFVLYTLVFFRIRGNIEFEGGRVSFRKTASAGSLESNGNYENRPLTLSKQMLWYPVTYTIIILPIAAARFSSWAGHDVPFEVTIFCDTVFLLSGVVNVTVFTMTRRILPPDSLKIPKWSLSPWPVQEYNTEAGPNPYSWDSRPYPDKAEFDGPTIQRDERY